MIFFLNLDIINFSENRDDILDNPFTFPVSVENILKSNICNSHDFDKVENQLSRLPIHFSRQKKDYQHFSYIKRIEPPKKKDYIDIIEVKLEKNMNKIHVEVTLKVSDSNLIEFQNTQKKMITFFFHSKDNIKDLFKNKNIESNIKNTKLLTNNKDKDNAINKITSFINKPKTKTLSLNKILNLDGYFHSEFNQDGHLKIDIKNIKKLNILEKYHIDRMILETHKNTFKISEIFLRYNKKIEAEFRIDNRNPFLSHNILFLEDKMDAGEDFDKTLMLLNFDVHYKKDILIPEISYLELKDTFLKFGFYDKLNNEDKDVLNYSKSALYKTTDFPLITRKDDKHMLCYFLNSFSKKEIDELKGNFNIKNEKDIDENILLILYINEKNIENIQKEFDFVKTSYNRILNAFEKYKNNSILFLEEIEKTLNIF